MSDEIVSYEQLLQSLLITNKAYKELKAENEKLREALDFYADENNYTKDGIIFSTEYVGQSFNINPEMSQVQDYGLVARQALGEK